MGEPSFSSPRCFCGLADTALPGRRGQATGDSNREGLGPKGSHADYQKRTSAIVGREKKHGREVVYSKKTLTPESFSYGSALRVAQRKRKF